MKLLSLFSGCGGMDILFISYAHLKYPIQQRYNINKQTAAGS